MKRVCQGYLPCVSCAQRGKQVVVGQFPLVLGLPGLKQAATEQTAAYQYVC